MDDLRNLMKARNRAAKAQRVLKHLDAKAGREITCADLEPWGVSDWQAAWRSAGETWNTSEPMATPHQVLALLAVRDRVRSERIRSRLAAV